MHRVSVLAICALLFFLISSCKQGKGIVDTEPEPPQSIEEALALWEAWRLNDYTLDQKVICLWCPYDGDSARIIVRAGAIQPILQYTAMTPLDKSLWDRYKSIDQLFEFAMGDTNVYTIEYEFDAQYGFPTWVQRSGKDASVDDYILGYKTSMFEPE